jgi:hypothetical protein
VIAVLEAALAVVMTKQCSLGKRTLFEALMPCLLADDDAPQHSQIAERFGMTTAAVKKEVSRLRHQYAIAIREQVASTMPIDGDIEDEIRELFRATKRTGS